MTQAATNIFFTGDGVPLGVALTPEQVLARVQDAELVANEAGVSAFVRLDVGDGREAIVRPEHVVMLLPPAPDEDEGVSE